MSNNDPSKRLMLTPREKEVIELAANGQSYEQIAKKLGIAFNTVHSHFKSVKLKLNATNMAHSITIAISRNLISG